MSEYILRQRDQIGYVDSHGVYVREIVLQRLDCDVSVKFEIRNSADLM